MHKIIATTLAGLALTLAGVAYAQNPFASITFPIVELGACSDLPSCKAYCDISANASVCFAYGKAHNLLPAGATPPTSTSPAEKAIKTGGPGGCTDVGQCKIYCSEAGHSGECIAFAKIHNLLAKNRLAEADKASIFLQLAASGQGPGACNSADSCKAYCGDPVHRSECVAFAQKAGLIDAIHAQQLTASTTLQGPGGCNSADSCAAFCNDSSNHEACVQFSHDHNLITPEQEKNIREGLSIHRGLANAPPAVLDCLGQSLGSEEAARLKQENITPNADILQTIRTCFEHSQMPGLPHSAASTTGITPTTMTATVTPMTPPLIHPPQLQHIQSFLYNTNTMLAGAVSAVLHILSGK